MNSHQKKKKLNKSYKRTKGKALLLQEWFLIISLKNGNQSKSTSRIVCKQLTKEQKVVYYDLIFLNKY